MADSNAPLHEKLFQQAETLLRQEIAVGKPVVAAWGLMNAGKSFLLNMLTNHIQTECFRTNDIRETAELKEFETNEFIFLDTPGLDANNGDDLIAQQGAAKADIVLFVHQPQGELEKIEIDFLHKLKESFGQYAEENIVLVLSKSDVESAEKIEAIKKRMLEQCRDELGFNPRCYAISGSRFHAGVTLKKDGLVRASHLNDLVEKLNQLRRDSGAVKRERHGIAIDELIEALKQAELSLREQHLLTTTEVREGFRPFDKAMSDFQVWMKRNLKKFPAV
ncbi:50S ribosome-binding GTPase [Cedecea davisae]|uniref:50S ribosome-binding GTPase n=1 Tax=Cedecea davisae TaxID=158484 RepID=A0ABS6DCX0_9ENTR|nr:GTPase [Cedecea davisae]MBU4680699.1 50S ribosome-binding GTPase [Cedecea davisae]MBU4685637.1 50S ribosome-binding GTPase [Cedecea davisae]